MRVTHLSGIDLNLLPLLDALLEERHVTRAAKRVGLSQPAASRGLARLRELCGDPLLVRSPRGLLPTPRAEALRAPVRQALTVLEQSLVEKVVFDPATASRKIRIVSDDYSELVLFPSLVSRLSSSAPGIDVLVPPTGPFEFEPLLRGEIDLALAPVRTNMPPPPGILVKKLYSERFVCVVRKGHPLAQRPTLPASPPRVTP
jgi:DNA-binding transcriptional LysR family regulator